MKAFNDTGFKLPWRIEFVPDAMTVYSADGRLLISVRGRDPREEDALIWMVSGLNRDGRLEATSEIFNDLTRSIERHGSPGPVRVSRLPTTPKGRR